VLLLTAGLAAPSRAQQARLDIQISHVQACDFSQPMGLVGTATVRVVSSFSFQTLRFKAPAPCGLLYLNATSAYPFTGDPQTGVDISLLACTSAPVDVLTIQFFAPFAASGCSWDVMPADGDTDILLTDCDGYTLKGASARSLYCGDVNGYIAPYRPDPPDGATDVPTNTLLSFTGAANELYLTDTGSSDLHNYVVCSTPLGVNCSNPFDPDLLQPHTTYYWQAVYWCAGTCPHGEGANSDVWSFTTGSGPLPAAASTWGHVKSLYR
jgi:hypothetical protein